MRISYQVTDILRERRGRVLNLPVVLREGKGGADLNFLDLAQ